MIVPNEFGLLASDAKMSGVWRNVWNPVGLALFGVLCIEIERTINAFE